MMTPGGKRPRNLPRIPGFSPSGDRHQAREFRCLNPGIGEPAQFYPAPRNIFSICQIATCSPSSTTRFAGSLK
jgi:hypothetical protein